MAEAIHKLKENMGLRNDLKDLKLTGQQFAEMYELFR